MYLPKSKYRGGLTTPGGEYEIKSNGETYVGPYFETFQGKFFTGNTPTKASIEIVRKVFKTDDNQAINGNLVVGVPNYYDNIRKNQQEVALKATLPVPVYYPKPTEKQYLAGFFSRYFLQENQTNRILEVSESVYTSIKKKETKYYYPKYNPIVLTWSLKSSVVNQGTIRTYSLTFLGIENYLKDPSQFVR
jgi:hypothetical protein